MPHSYVWVIIGKPSILQGDPLSWHDSHASFIRVSHYWEALYLTRKPSIVTRLTCLIHTCDMTHRKPWWSPWSHSLSWIHSELEVLLLLYASNCSTICVTHGSVICVMWHTENPQDLHVIKSPQISSNLSELFILLHDSNSSSLYVTHSSFIRVTWPTGNPQDLHDLMNSPQFSPALTGKPSIGGGIMMVEVLLYCSLLQCLAVCGSVLQCVAVCCCNVLQQYVALYRWRHHDDGGIVVLQCVAVCCSVLQCVAVCCSVWEYLAVCCSVLQCVAVCCSVL